MILGTAGVVLDCGHGQQKEEHQEKDQKIRQPAEQASEKEARKSNPEARKQEKEESIENANDGKEKILEE